ncbi:MAG: hypothetical protein V4719_23000 [Planctomycetota bacterium]
MKHYLGIACVALGLSTATGYLAAQDSAASPPPAAKTGEGKPPTEAEIKAEEARILGLRADQELRSRLDDTVWNDVDLHAGQPGQVWLFRPAARKAKKDVREWYLNDDVKLPLVGTWAVQKSEILLYALDGTLIGRGKYDDDEIVGHFIDPDRKKAFGKFRLREETKRSYRVLPLRVITPTLGR